MLTREDYLMIDEKRRQGAYIKDIAQDLGVHPRTVRRALKRGSEPPRRPSCRPSKLDPFKARVDEILVKNQDIYGRLRSVNLMRDTVRGHIFGVFVGPDSGPAP